MELKELRSLAAHADLKSLSAVAEHTHLSPPAVHKQLKILESELEVPLYEKVDKQLQLTRAANVLLPHIKETFANLEFAHAALDQWKGIHPGSVRIGSGPSLYVLPCILKHFRQAHREVEVIVKTGNTPTLLEDLRNGALDVAFVASADLSQRKEFIIETFWNFDLVTVTSMKRLPARPRLAVKKADRGNGIIVRFYESTGQSVSTPVTFLRHERHVRLVNLLEEPGKLPEAMIVAVRPYGIETVEIPAAAAPRRSRK